MDNSLAVLNFNAVGGFDFQFVKRKLEQEWRIINRVVEKIETAASQSKKNHT
jgi:hypothetical protein